MEAKVEDLTRKNHELEWITISLCRRTHSLTDRIGSREDRRHQPYLRARGYGDVLQRQMGRRTGGPGKHLISAEDLSDYTSD
jgi:hypothetical protein